MNRILVVDDEASIRDIIRKYAEFERCHVSEAGNGEQALAMMAENSYDVVILDVMMPVMDGFSTLREMRREHNHTPVIMLTARGEEYDRIHGFELGVDDYVVKPFSPKELMLRVAAVIRRVTGETESHKVFALDGLSIDFTGRVVTVDGVRADLSPKEYDLLFYFVQNRGIALSRDRLLREIWGYDFFGDDRTIDTHIKLLRKKLGRYSDKITTLRGVGYRFEKE